MKSIIIAISTAVLLFSCIKEQPCNPGKELSDRTTVKFTFVNDATGTRAFFDNSGTAETWEKSLSSITIYVFSPSGDLVAERFFTSAELSAKSATMALPVGMADKNCEFYALANETVAGINKRSDLDAKLEKIPGAYNGTFADVSTKSVRAGGFVMSGTASKKIGAPGSSTQVQIVLKRSVAKIAVQTAVDPSFTQKYSGTITIKSVKIAGAAQQTKYFYSPTLDTGPLSFSHTQTPASLSDKFNSLFYIYENGVLPSNSRVILEITANYDADGNAATTNDLIEVPYTVELNGTAASGKIDRNGYYRIAVNITGLAGDELDFGVTIADWEIPTTQNINIGL